MITVSHPIDDLELILLRAALDGAEVPYFVLGAHLGSLFPGLQIGALNERTIQVPDDCVGAALAVIADVRATYSPSSGELSIRSKFRILLEWMLLGWPVLAGTKRVDTNCR